LGASRPLLRSSAADDVALLRHIASGDRQALGVLYDRHSGVMLALGVRIIGGQHEAEDVLHDVFLEIWRHAGDYDPGRGSVKAWLLVRMRAHGLDRMRSRESSRAETSADGPFHGALDTRGALDLDAASARALLDRLPAGERAVLELGYFKGLAFPEIAAALGVPVGIVKSRASTGLMQLRTQLGVGREASS
jgi:RNA polymerase sigma-70 factor (ECF subfamily)